MTPNQLKQMTDTPEKQEHLLIAYIRMYAHNQQIKFSNSNWDLVTEFMLDGDILEFLSEAQFHLPTAIDAIEAYVNSSDIYIEKREYNPDNYRGI
jgi:hypothetical protein